MQAKFPLSPIEKSGTLSLTQCKELMNSVKRQAKEHNNTLTNGVIDCALVDGKLVIYELQSIFNSEISQHAFLKSIGRGNQALFDTSFYIGNGNWNKLSIKIETGQTVQLFDLKNYFSMPEYYEKIVDFFKPDSKNILVVVDKPDSLHKKVWMRIMNQSKHDNCNLYFNGTTQLDPSQYVFPLKHLQRVIMSETELTPLFVFIENKDSYTEDDLKAIKESLCLTDNDALIIKSNNGTRGEYNTVLKVSELSDFLNSQARKERYTDSVLLLEQIKNEKKNGLYDTHRYAAGMLPDEAFFCIDVYNEKHQEIDSHISPQKSWLNQTINDPVQYNQIKQLLHTINRLDYFDLVEKLLHSNNVVNILIGIDFLKHIHEFLFSYPKLTCNEEWPKKLDFCLNISEYMIGRLKNLFNGQHTTIRNKTLELVLVILQSYEALNKAPWSIDRTDINIISQLNEIKSTGTADEIALIYNKGTERMLRTMFSQPTFFATTNNTNGHSILDDWELKLQTDFSMTDKDLVRLDGPETLYKKCLEIQKMIKEENGLIWKLTNGNIKNAKRILDTIIASPVLFKQFFSNLLIIGTFLWCDSEREKSIVNSLLTNGSLFNHCIPNSEQLNEACSMFKEHAQLFKNKFSELNMEVEENNSLSSRMS